MSDARPPDVHAPHVGELAEAGDWPALARYWMAHKYQPALDLSTALVGQRVAEQGPWPVLAAWLEGFRVDPIIFERDWPAIDFDKLGQQGAESIELLILFPRIALCQLGQHFPIEHQVGAYRAGLSAVDQAIPLAEASDDWALIAFLQILQASSQRNLGDPKGARASYEEALRKYRDLALARPDAYRPLVAGTLNNLGNARSDLGDLEGAKASYEEALREYRDLALARPDAHRPDLAMTLNNLGNARSALGDPEGARASYDEALAIRRALAEARPEVYRPDLAMTLNNLGNARSALGDPEGARASYDEALAIRRALAEARPEVYRPDLAMTLNNLGNARRSLGDAEGARASFDEALAIRRALAQARPEFYRPDLAGTLNNLGTARSALGDPEGARASYEEALAIRRALAQARPEFYRPDVAETLNNLGAALRSLGDAEGARASFDEALAIRRALAQARPDAYRPLVAMTLNNLGTAQSDLGDAEGARASFEEANGIYEDMNHSHSGQSQMDRIRCGNNLGRLLLTDDRRRGWPDRWAARQVLQKTCLLAEAHRGRFIDPRQRRRIQEETLALYSLLVRVCVELWLLLGDRDALQEAVTVTETSRARRLMELLAEEDLRPADSPPGLFDEFLRLRARLREAERQLDDESARFAPKPERPGHDVAAEGGEITSQITPVGRGGITARLQEIIARTIPTYLESLKRLQAHDPEFNPDRPVPPIDFEQMCRLVPNDVPTAAILFTVTADLGVALIVTADGVDAVRLPELATRHGVELANAWYAAYYGTCRRANGSLDGDAWAKSIAGLLEPIASAIIRPVVEKLDRVIKRLILLPNQTLHLFPLHACRLADGRLLADAFEVTYAPSLSILHRCRSRQRAEPRRLLTVEDPTLDLAFAGYEANAVGRHFDERTSRRGADARREWLLEHAAGLDTWHYSGHSGFDPYDPLASGLVLEDQKTPDRWLTLRDVFTSLRLTDTSLAVLSGCESGNIRPDEIDEMIGFPAGFLFAGATCVVSSLWTVQDLATALTMDRFYQEWRFHRRPVGAALREAQRWLREDFKTGHDVVAHVTSAEFLAHVPDEKTRQRCEIQAKAIARKFTDSPPFASPAYWAAFTATGWAFA